MNRSTVLTAALFALSLAPALQAQRWGTRDQDRYGYPGYGQRDRAAVLARELAATADSIHRQAERNNRRPDRAEARVLADLHELDARAERFYREVEGSGYRQDGYQRDRRYGTNGFAALEKAFFSLGDSLRYIQPRGYIDRGMARIDDLMNELGRYYGRSSGYDRRGYGRERQGFDPYGRYDRQGDRDRFDRREDLRDDDRDDDDD
jgi:hypothetical protein